MELKDYIEAGIRKKNGVGSLATFLGIHPNHVSNAKAHSRGLPADACVKLSDLLNVELKTIIAASELATERKEEKRAFWLPFVKNARDLTKLASYALILTVVTKFVTTSPAEAATRRHLGTDTVCIMLSRKIFSCFTGFLKIIRFFVANTPHNDPLPLFCSSVKTDDNTNAVLQDQNLHRSDTFFAWQPNGKADAVLTGHNYVMP